MVEIDKNYYRPTEVDLLIGDASKAKEILNWEPKIELESLIKEMVESDVTLFKKDIHLKKGGFDSLNQYE